MEQLRTCLELFIVSACARGASHTQRGSIPCGVKVKPMEKPESSWGSKPGNGRIDIATVNGIALAAVRTHSP